MEEQRLTIQEAAHRLGVSESAIRKRLKRGTLRSDKTEDGRVLVTLGPEDVPVSDTVPNPPVDALISRLEDEVEFLRSELQRKDHLLAAALERIPPALEAPQEPPESPPRAGPTPEATPASEGLQEDAQRVSWWRRFFGFD